MSFFLPTLASNSSASSNTSSPLDTGLTTLDDVARSDLTKTSPGNGQQTEVSALIQSPIPEEGEVEAEGSSRYTPHSQAPSERNATTTFPGGLNIAFSDTGVGAREESGVSSSGSSEYSYRRRSSSGSSSSSDERGDLTSTARTRATTGETVWGAQTTIASTAPSPSVVSTLPRIRLQQETPTRSLLFEPLFESSRQEEKSHRRRSSGTTTPAPRRRRLVYRYEERRISRDFLLLIALCIGLACFFILVGRPAMMSLLGRNNNSALFDFDFE